MSAMQGNPTNPFIPPVPAPPPVVQNTVMTPVAPGDPGVPAAPPVVQNTVMTPVAPGVPAAPLVVQNTVMTPVTPGDPGVLVPQDPVVEAQAVKSKQKVRNLNFIKLVALVVGLFLFLVGSIVLGVYLAFYFVGSSKVTVTKVGNNAFSIKDKNTTTIIKYPNARSYFEPNQKITAYRVGKKYSLSSTKGTVIKGLSIGILIIAIPIILAMVLSIVISIIIENRKSH